MTASESTTSSENTGDESQNPSQSFHHPRFQWYAVLTQSGMEKKARASLEERIVKLKLSDYFGQVLIPTMVLEKVDASGKKKKSEQRIMPGYVFIQIDPANKNAFTCVKDTPRISKFVAAQANQDPQPVPPEEIERLFVKSKETKQKAEQKAAVAFEKGERVKVIDGPFTNFIGDVDEVKADKMKLRLLISVFGRATPVEIEFSKVEKVKE